jgi:hypothetical protein
MATVYVKRIRNGEVVKEVVTDFTGAELQKMIDGLCRNMDRTKFYAVLGPGDEGAADLDRAEMLQSMMKTGCVWMYDDDERREIIFEVNCNDLWSWASADSEEIPYDEIENCHKLGPITWACIRRNCRPFDACEEQMKAKGEWNEHLEALPKHGQRG